MTLKHRIQKTQKEQEVVHGKNMKLNGESRPGSDTDMA
jgi:hypothetical protein